MGGGYCPLERFPSESIAPTTEDKFLRKQPLHVYVHDEGAALLGGKLGTADFLLTPMMWLNDVTE